MKTRRFAKISPGQKMRPAKLKNAAAKLAVA
jgi:hypothetical protein